MIKLNDYDPEDEDNTSNDDQADDFSFDLDDPIIKGEDDYPNIS